jgi:hypothetical protein
MEYSLVHSVYTASNGRLKMNWKEVVIPSESCLELLRRTAKNISQDRKRHSRDSNRSSL